MSRATSLLHLSLVMVALLLTTGCRSPLPLAHTAAAPAPEFPQPTVDAIQESRGDFAFAVLPDNSGGTRAGVLEEAVGDLNRLQPAFVVGIGDMIEGYTTDTAELTRQWVDYDAKVKPLQMPFFRIAGNHDIGSAAQRALWTKRYGPTYGSFIYRDVLIIRLDSVSKDGPEPRFDAEQIDWACRTLAATAGKVRWTFVMMHHRMWKNTAPDNLWPKLEAALAGRPHTVICGHVHRSSAEQRGGITYLTLGTAGGAIADPPEPGQMDHLLWVTMRDGQPHMANLKLDGVLDTAATDAKKD